MDQRNYSSFSSGRKGTFNHKPSLVSGCFTTAVLEALLWKPRVHLVAVSLESTLLETICFSFSLQGASMEDHLCPENVNKT